MNRGAIAILALTMALTNIAWMIGYQRLAHAYVACQADDAANNAAASELERKYHETPNR